MNPMLLMLIAQDPDRWGPMLDQMGLPPPGQVFQGTPLGAMLTGGGPPPASGDLTGRLVDAGPASGQPPGIVSVQHGGPPGVPTIGAPPPRADQDGLHPLPSDSMGNQIDTRSMPGSRLNLPPPPAADAPPPAAPAPAPGIGDMLRQFFSGGPPPPTAPGIPGADLPYSGPPIAAAPPPPPPAAVAPPAPAVEAPPPPAADLGTILSTGPGQVTIQNGDPWAGVDLNNPGGAIAPGTIDLSSIVTGGTPPPGLVAPPGAGPGTVREARVAPPPGAGEGGPGSAGMQFRAPTVPMPVFSGGVAGAQKAPDMRLQAVNPGMTANTALMQALLAHAQDPLRVPTLGRILANR